VSFASLSSFSPSISHAGWWPPWRAPHRVFSGREMHPTEVTIVSAFSRCLRFIELWTVGP
jgi:hypothetical protein